MDAMGRVAVLVFALELLLVVVALISCLSAHDDQVRTLPRLIWVLVILLFPIAGPLLYLLAGRPLPSGPRPGSPIAGRLGDRPVRAPDDDPEFLAQLNRQTRRDEGTGGEPNVR
jgi:hypothetical protein